MLRAGERVGEWIIEAPLGEGGMGAVYRVHSALTQRLVAALKVMKPTAEPDARARFVREAEALSALRHPAVVRVMGFSEDPERGLLCLVMELAVGETLRQRVSRGAMELPEALATFVPLAQGLDHAHASGIFHRDLKPANVILTVDGTPRLVDFGIAAALHAEPLTTTGQLGTLPYLPPETSAASAGTRPPSTSTRSACCWTRPSPRSGRSRWIPGSPRPPPRPPSAYARAVREARGAGEGAGVAPAVTREPFTPAGPIQVTWIESTLSG